MGVCGAGLWFAAERGGLPAQFQPSPAVAPSLNEHLVELNQQRLEPIAKKLVRPTKKGDGKTIAVWKFRKK